jgi:hypothetical protein
LRIHRTGRSPALIASGAGARAGGGQARGQAGGPRFVIAQVPKPTRTCASPPGTRGDRLSRGQALAAYSRRVQNQSDPAHPRQEHPRFETAQVPKTKPNLRSSLAAHSKLLMKQSRAVLLREGSARAMRGDRLSRGRALAPQTSPLKEQTEW